jgi:elongation factor Ts
LVAVEIAPDRKSASIVEVNSETDFVARNEKFQNLVEEIAAAALLTDAVLDAKTSDGQSIGEAINHLISLIGENITFRRAERLDVLNGVVAAYVHNAVKSNMGKIAVLVAIEAKCSCECSCKQAESVTKLEEFGKKLAMHVAAANPSYLCPSCVPQEIIEKEKEIIRAQAVSLGKPDNIAEKMAEGRIKKFCEESVLLEQVYVIDGKTKVADVVAAHSKELGCELKIAGFTKYVLGEGIDIETKNFAEEVSSFLK